MSELKPISANGETGVITVTMEDQSGTTHTMNLSAFDVSTFVSMLYSARATALKQPPPIGPETMLPIFQLFLGCDPQYQILRISVGEGLHQDFCAKTDTEIGQFLKVMADASAKAFGAAPTSWGNPYAGSKN